MTLGRTRGALVAYALTLNVLSASNATASVPESAPVMGKVRGVVAASDDAKSEDIVAEDEGGIASPGIYAYDPIAACLTDLACIGCSTLDETIFGGRFRAVYQIILGWTGVGTLIGGALGFILGVIPAGFLGYAAFTATAASGSPQDAPYNALSTTCGTIIFCAGAGSIALAIVGAAIGSIHALVLWMTDELPGTRPPAWDQDQPKRRRAARLERPAPPSHARGTPLAY